MNYISIYIYNGALMYVKHTAPGIEDVWLHRMLLHSAPANTLTKKIEQIKIGL